jgi:hypothetical protein
MSPNALGSCGCPLGFLAYVRSDMAQAMERSELEPAERPRRAG